MITGKHLNKVLASPVVSALKWREHSDNGIQQFEPEIAEGSQEDQLQKELARGVLRQAHVEPEREKHSFLSPSQAGKCPRLSAMKKLPERFPPEPQAARSKLNFIQGDLLEAAHRYLLKQSPDPMFEFIETPEAVEIPIGRGKMGKRETSTGFFDGVLAIHYEQLAAYGGFGDLAYWREKSRVLGRTHIRVLWEMKTMGSFAFKRLKRTGLIDGEASSLEPGFGYPHQLALYLRAGMLPRKGPNGDLPPLLDAPIAILYAINKDQSDIFEVVRHIDQLSFELSEADDNFEMVSDCVRKGGPLPKPKYELGGRTRPTPRNPEGRQKPDNQLNYPCTYCEFKINCRSRYADGSLVKIKEWIPANPEADKIFFTPVFEGNPVEWVDMTSKSPPTWGVVKAKNEPEGHAQ